MILGAQIVPVLSAGLMLLPLAVHAPRLPDNPGPKTEASVGALSGFWVGCLESGGLPLLPC